MKKLTDKKIALLGSRKIEEISKIVENLGGIPLSRPAQGTILLDDSNLEERLLELLDGKFEWIIFTTGIGVETFYNLAQKSGKGEHFISRLQNMKIAARGYKTVNMLKKLGLTPLVRDDDGSTAGLIRSLAAFSLENRKVALQLHGDPAPQLMQWLHDQKANYVEVLPYLHIKPDENIMNQLLSEILTNEIDAVFFTSTPQVRNLVSFARNQGRIKELFDVFSQQVIVLAVGKVTAQALHDEGIEQVLFPQIERMGSAIVELANYYNRNS